MRFHFHLYAVSYIFQSDKKIKKRGNRIKQQGMNFGECSSSKDTILQIQLEYVRYGIEMKMETHKAIRSQHKTIEETKQ